MEKNKKIICIFILIILCCLFVPNLNLVTLYNGQSENLTYKILTFDEEQNGIIQFNRISPEGRNIYYETVDGTLIEQDYTFDGNINTVRINLTSPTTQVYEIYTDEGVSETDLPIESKSYYIKSDISNLYFPISLDVSETKTVYALKENGHSPTTLDYILYGNGDDTIYTDDLQIFPNTDNFKIKIWVNIPSGITSDDVLFHAGQSGTNNDFMLYSNTNYGTAVNQLRLYHRGTGEIFIGSDIRGTGWRYLEVERDGNTFNLYLDGELDASGTSSNDYIGTRLRMLYKFESDSMNYMHGSIGSVEMVDANDNLILKYRINEGNGNTLYDKSTRQYNAYASASWQSSDIIFDDQNSASTSITDMGTYYKIDVTNNKNYQLDNFNVEIPSTNITLTSSDESWYINDKLPSDYTISVTRSVEYPVIKNNYINATIDTCAIKPETNYTYHEWYIEENFTKYETETFSPDLVIYSNETGIKNATLYSYENDRLMEINNYEINFTEDNSSNNVQIVTETVTKTVTNTVTDTKTVVVEKEVEVPTITTNQKKIIISDYSTEILIASLFLICALLAYSISKK